MGPGFLRPERPGCCPTVRVPCRAGALAAGRTSLCDSFKKGPSAGRPCWHGVTHGQHRRETSRPRSWLHANRRRGGDADLTVIGSRYPLPDCTPVRSEVVSRCSERGRSAASSAPQWGGGGVLVRSRRFRSNYRRATTGWTSGLPEIVRPIPTWRLALPPVRHRPNPPGQEQAVGVFASNDAADPGVSPRCRPNRELLRGRPRSLDRRDDAGVVVRRWAVDRHRQAWTKQERPAPIDDALFKPGCAKTYCRRPRSVGQQRRSRGPTCWPGQCRHTGLIGPVHFARQGGRQEISRWRLSFW